jgi:hypothetical protein
MFLTTHSRAPSKWFYLLLALGFMMIRVGPVVLLGFIRLTYRAT